MNRIVLLFLLLLSTVHATAQKAEQALPVTIHVTGLVEHELTLDAATITSLPVQKKNGFDLINDKNEVKKKITSFKGILLADIIRKAGVKMEDHKDRGKYYIVVTATDHYQVVFGYDEVMFGADAAAAYLMLEVNGKAMGNNGPYIIACPGDKVTGPRYIKMVQEIEVRKI
jgi:DMSO/TMAO reductase YedYZ molybdopterin-dependent catalytic subunit